MERDWVSMAAGEGFANAAMVKTAEIPFEPGFLVCCQENLCGKYGANYACPPDCGTPAQMQQKLQAHAQALVLQTIWEIADPMDNREIRPAKAAHNQMVRRLLDRMGLPGLMVGASGCDLCRSCAIAEGAPCQYPALQFSCMSAYCVFVRRLAEQCGMEYDCGPGLVGLFGLIAFDEP